MTLQVQMYPQPLCDNVSSLLLTKTKNSWRELKSQGESKHFQDMTVHTLYFEESRHPGLTTELIKSILTSFHNLSTKKLCQLTSFNQALLHEFTQALYWGKTKSSSTLASVHCLPSSALGALGQLRLQLRQESNWTTVWNHISYSIQKN